MADASDIKTIGRRKFLTASAALGGVVATGAVMAQDSDANKVLSSANDLGIAEKIAGLNYTDAERASIYDGLEGMVDRVRSRRTNAPLANEDAPAQTFDPRLPGRTYSPQDNHVVLRGKIRIMPAREVDIAFASIADQGAWIREGKLTSTRLTEIYLKRIEKHGPKLECYITVMAETARAEASRADTEMRNGKDRGPLHGIPYGLKDLADTAGTKTTWGATPYKDRVPTEDAAIVKKLQEAGAVLLGKTSLGALAYNDLWFGGLTKNPWNMDEGSSGSSAGSASATTSGLCGFSIGTETLGSIVSPSTRCGAVGLRPTFGRVARSGAMALCWSLDKIGAICRQVDDTALVLAAINGQDNGDPSSLDHGFHYDSDEALKGLKIGYDPAWFENATVTDKAVLERVRKLGLSVSKIKLPDMPFGALITTLEVEAAAAFEELTLSNRDDLMRWQEDRAWPNTFRGAHFLSAVEALQVDRFRRKVMAAMADIYDQVDVIISPNFTGGMLLITNYTGTPSLTVPVGMEKRASVPLTGQPAPTESPALKLLPHTFTLWGNMFREDQILALGRKLEEGTGFYTNRRPAL